MNEKSKPIAGLTVVLKEKDGEKHYSTGTEYDGYYYFPNVSQGNYILEIEKNEQRSENITRKNLPEHLLTNTS
ncbi:SdrD B-like domain-containing protein [Pseudoalteromonas sp. S3173]|uniref:SdrD B-like domain-containing protein n=1 Tax=Pseudoalteromonas sp. S3173 TaxID=579531 RepID=UPI0024B4FF81|nr:SdrD B-like domain-containing protein [Pseudoalteromonas sp. S3173]